MTRHTCWSRAPASTWRTSRASEALADFRIMCVAGASDSGAVRAHARHVEAGSVQTLRALASWRLGNVGRDGIRTYGGGDT